MKKRYTAQVKVSFVTQVEFSWDDCGDREIDQAAIDAVMNGDYDGYDAYEVLLVEED